MKEPNAIEKFNFALAIKQKREEKEKQLKLYSEKSNHSSSQAVAQRKTRQLAVTSSTNEKIVEYISSYKDFFSVSSSLQQHHQAADQLSIVSEAFLVLDGLPLTLTLLHLASNAAGSNTMKEQYELNKRVMQSAEQDIKLCLQANEQLYQLDVPHYLLTTDCLSYNSLLQSIRSKIERNIFSDASDAEDIVAYIEKLQAESKNLHDEIHFLHALWLMAKLDDSPEHQHAMLAMQKIVLAGFKEAAAIRNANLNEAIHNYALLILSQSILERKIALAKNDSLKRLPNILLFTGIIAGAVTSSVLTGGAAAPVVVPLALHSGQVLGIYNTAFADFAEGIELNRIASVEEKIHEHIHHSEQQSFFSHHALQYAKERAKAQIRESKALLAAMREVQAEYKEDKEFQQHIDTINELVQRLQKQLQYSNLPRSINEKYNVAETLLESVQAINSYRQKHFADNSPEVLTALLGPSEAESQLQEKIAVMQQLFIDSHFAVEKLKTLYAQQKTHSSLRYIKSSNTETDYSENRQYYPEIDRFNSLESSLAAEEKLAEQLTAMQAINQQAEIFLQRAADYQHSACGLKTKSLFIADMEQFIAANTDPVNNSKARLSASTRPSVYCYELQFTERNWQRIQQQLADNLRAVEDYAQGAESVKFNSDNPLSETEIAQYRQYYQQTKAEIITAIETSNHLIAKLYELDKECRKEQFQKLPPQTDDAQTDSARAQALPARHQALYRQAEDLTENWRKNINPRLRTVASNMQALGIVAQPAAKPPVATSSTPSKTTEAVEVLTEATSHHETTPADSASETASVESVAQATDNELTNKTVGKKVAIEETPANAVVVQQNQPFMDNKTVNAQQPSINAVVEEESADTAEENFLFAYTSHLTKIGAPKKGSGLPTEEMPVLVENTPAEATTTAKQSTNLIGTTAGYTATRK